jgi:F-type H+-transporting ATPase subunit gamma
MAGAGLIAIKRRIKSVTNTRKITKAMGLVATAKLRKSREKLEVNHKYYEAFQGAMDDILKDANDMLEEHSIYIDGNKGNKKLYIVLTSDSGLCGGFNANIVAAASQAMHDDRANSLSIIVGQKGRLYFRRLKYETAAEFVQIPDLPTIKEAKVIARKALSMYDSGEVSEVYVVYTKFFSAVKQEAEVQRLLPLAAPKDHVDKAYTQYEPDIDALLKQAVKVHISQKLMHFMLNAKASEQGSRMSAMNGATKNANDLLESLNLKYNRVRQSAITQEISEIVGGAEAQK